MFCSLQHLPWLPIAHRTWWMGAQCQFPHTLPEPGIATPLPAVPAARALHRVPPQDPALSLGLSLGPRHPHPPPRSPAPGSEVHSFEPLMAEAAGHHAPRGSLRMEAALHLRPASGRRDPVARHWCGSCVLGVPLDPAVKWCGPDLGLDRYWSQELPPDGHRCRQTRGHQRTWLAVMTPRSPSASSDASKLGIMVPKYVLTWACV